MDAINANRTTLDLQGPTSPTTPQGFSSRDPASLHPDAAIADADLDQFLHEHGYSVPEGIDCTAKRVLVREALDAKAAKRVRADEP